MKDALALACLPLAAAAAQAGPVPWNFDARQSTFAVVGDPGNLGVVCFAKSFGSSSDSQTIPILSVYAVTSPIGQHADTYSGDPFSVVLGVTDARSGDLGEFDFSGSLSGSVTSGGASLTGTFDGPQTEHQTLGGHDYAVTVGPLVSPESRTAPGSLSVSVAIDAGVAPPSVAAASFAAALPAAALPAALPPTVAGAPEPSGATLAALALAAVGRVFVRRRRAVG